MTTNGPIWFHSLTDSVFALGAAAREYRAANEAARSATWHIEPARLLPVDGALNVPGKGRFSPHYNALFRLEELYRAVENRTRDLYENAALAYAHGTASVLQALIRGEQPRFVELARHNHQYVLSDTPLPDLTPALGRWPGVRRLAELRNQLNERQQAHRTLNSPEEQRHLWDHEVAELYDTAELAAGLADCAYAYGERAEGAMNFLILTARANQTSEEDQ
ncbi:hypothetical protein ACIGXM_03640 [Kitasatospora sp. NPDC052896]|uniref:hypothetical protein n=1 Tax=Kitasatospora sp. NPDC052896 TaxID=3364061 RepID=UPI0037C91581